MAKAEVVEEVTHEEAVAEDAKTSTKADIIRGRMPEVLVHHIRFGVEGKASELAKVYHTTPGKIADIQKVAGFKYILEDFKPSADMVAKGMAWADSMHERGDETGAEDLRTVLGAMEIGTEAELAAQDAARIGTRKPRGKKEGAVAEVEPAEAVDTSADDGLDGLVD